MSFFLHHAKIRFNLLLILLTLTLCGCVQSTTGAIPPADSVSSAPADISYVPDIGDPEPSWVQPPRKEDGKFFTSLNLDGIGDKDDEVYLAAYCLDDRDSASSVATILWVKLGTGETFAAMFPVIGNYSFHTGHLFSDNKDAIVLEVTSRESNFGYSNIFVLDIFPPNPEDPRTIMVERLNTAAGPHMTPYGDVVRLDPDAASIVLADGTELFSNANMTDGTEIIDIPGQSLQGLRLYATGEESGVYSRGQSKDILWSDNGWNLVE